MSKYFIFIIFSLSTSLSASVIVRKRLRRNILNDFRAHGVESLLKREQSSQYSNELVELGRNLFFDKILSGNKTISCATCHTPSVGTGDGIAVSIGEGGEGIAANRLLKNANLIPRNAPAVYNRGLKGYNLVMWDGRIGRSDDGILQTPEVMLNGTDADLKEIVAQIKSTLAAQALFPITSHDEMRGQKGSNEIADAPNNKELWKRLTKRIIKIKEYRKLLKEAYPESKLKNINIGHIANAIGAYESIAFRATSTAFDHFLSGKLYALSDTQVRGAKIFLNKGRCIECHNGPFLTDFKAYSISVPQIGPGKNKEKEDYGMELITGKIEDRYKFKTPSLRNVALTGPYMHDGFFTSLRDAVRFHCHPETHFKSYMEGNTQKHSTLFEKTIDRNQNTNDMRLESLDTKLKGIPEFSSKDLDDLLNFLYGLTDMNSLQRPWGGIPAKVPSGIAVQN